MVHLSLMFQTESQLLYCIHQFTNTKFVSVRKCINLKVEIVHEKYRGVMLSHRLLSQSF